LETPSIKICYPSPIVSHGAVTLKACVGVNKPEDLAWAEQRGFVNGQINLILAPKRTNALMYKNTLMHIIIQPELGGKSSYEIKLFGAK
jgi:hypothetical protein